MIRIFVVISLVLCACFLFGCTEVPAICRDVDCDCDVTAANGSL